MVVGQQSTQMAKRSYTYDAIMRLNNIENCLIDMQRSRDDVMSNIGQILEKEKSKLVLQREKSSSLLRLSRYHTEIADQSKALEENRRRINTLRENIRSRRAALEEAKKRYQTGNDYLEMVVLKRIAVLSEALSKTSSKLYARQKELAADLLAIFPIEPAHTETFTFKILGVPLPNSVFTGCDDETVSTALGFASHLIHMLAYYLEVPLRFPLKPMSSRSTINDPITASLGDSRQDYNTEYVTCRVPFKRLLNWIILSIVQLEGLCTNNQLGALFPLYAKGSDRYRFEYAVFLLNKNIEQLMNSQGLVNLVDLRNTLPNLKYLILSLISSSSSASHPRKFIQRNTNNAIASTSNNHDPFLEEEEINVLQKSTNESRRRTASQGFKVGIT